MTTTNVNYIIFILWLFSLCFIDRERERIPKKVKPFLINRFIPVTVVLQRQIH